MEKSQKSSRRRARQKAFQCLYSLGYHQNDLLDGLTKTFDNFFGSDFPSPSKDKEFIDEVFKGVTENQDNLDNIITSHSKHWKLVRIAKIELGILRVAIYEMLYRPDIPLKVSINEAIELSKVFGDDNSRSFINGILDAVAKGISNGEFGTHKTF